MGGGAGGWVGGHVRSYVSSFRSHPIALSKHGTRELEDPLSLSYPHRTDLSLSLSCFLSVQCKRKQRKKVYHFCFSRD